LLEGIRSGTAPAAIINFNVDPIIALGAIVAEELYHKTVPIVALAQEDYAAIRDGDYLTINPNGKIVITPVHSNDLVP